MNLNLDIFDDYLFNKDIKMSFEDTEFLSDVFSFNNTAAELNTMLNQSFHIKTALENLENIKNILENNNGNVSPALQALVGNSLGGTISLQTVNEKIEYGMEGFREIFRSIIQKFKEWWLKIVTLFTGLQTRLSDVILQVQNTANYVQVTPFKGLNFTVLQNFEQIINRSIIAYMVDVVNHKATSGTDYTDGTIFNKNSQLVEINFNQQGGHDPKKVKQLLLDYLKLLDTLLTDTKNKGNIKNFWDKIAMRFDVNKQADDTSVDIKDVVTRMVSQYTTGVNRVNSTVAAVIAHVRWNEIPKTTTTTNP